MFGTCLMFGFWDLVVVFNYRHENLYSTSTMDNLLGTLVRPHILLVYIQAFQRINKYVYTEMLISLRSEKTCATARSASNSTKSVTVPSFEIRRYGFDRRMIGVTRSVKFRGSSGHRQGIFRSRNFFPTRLWYPSFSCHFTFSSVVVSVSIVISHFTMIT